MSYQIPQSAPIVRLIDYCTGVIASLTAQSQSQSVAGNWVALRQKLLLERQACEESKWNRIGATARVRLWDARWDALVTEISGHAFLAAGKNTKAEPYLSLFGQIRAVDARNMGPHKAQIFGARRLARSWTWRSCTRPGHAAAPHLVGGVIQPWM